MSAPRECDSSSDVSTDSSWTILDVQSPELENVIAAKDSTSSVSSIPPDEQSCLKISRSQPDLKKAGFLTLNELLQEREIEHDYEYDNLRERLDRKVSKTKNKNKRKKYKAECVATLSIVGTVLAVTGISFLCMLAPSIGSSTEMPSRSKVNLPKFEKVNMNVNYSIPLYSKADSSDLTIFDEDNFIKTALNQASCHHAKRHHADKCPADIKPTTTTTATKDKKADKCQVDPMGPMTQESWRRGHENKCMKASDKYPKNSKKIPRQAPDDVSSTTSTRKVPKNETTKTNSKYATKKAQPTVSKKPLVPVVEATLAAQVCQDVVLLQSVSAIQKMHSSKRAEKIAREKRKESKKDKSRKSLRLLKITPKDSLLLIPSTQGSEKKGKEVSSVPNIPKQLKDSDVTLSELTHQVKKQEVKIRQYLSKTKLSDSKSIGAAGVEQKEATKRQDGDGSPFSNKSVSFATSCQDISEFSKLMTKEEIDTYRNIGLNRSQLDVAADSSKELARVCKQYLVLKKSRTALRKDIKAVVSDKRLEELPAFRREEILNQIYTARDEYDAKFQKFREALKKAVMTEEEKLNHNEKVKDAATGFYQIKDIEDFKGRLKTLREKAKHGVSVEDNSAKNFIGSNIPTNTLGNRQMPAKRNKDRKKGDQKAQDLHDLEEDKNYPMVKAFLDNVIHQVVQDIQNKRKREAESDGEESSSEKCCVQKNNSDVLYCRMFGNRGREIKKTDDSHWKFEDKPNWCDSKPLSKQDPKRCYITKVTPF